MNKIVLAVLLIILGLILFLKSTGLLPGNYGVSFLEFAKHYWPILLILYGTHVLIKEKMPVVSQGLIWLILFFSWFVVNLPSFGGKLLGHLKNKDEEGFRCLIIHG